MLTKTIKSRLLIPWYILLVSLIIISIIRFGFILNSRKDLDHSALHKQTMIYSYKLKNLHDYIFLNILTYTNVKDLNPLLHRESNNIDNIYEELLKNLDIIEKYHDPDFHKMDRQHYETYKTLNSEIFTLYQRFVQFKENSNSEKQMILQDLIEEKNLLISATLDDIIIINEKQEELSSTQTVNRIINGFFYQSGSILLVVIMAIVLTIFQFRTISVPASKLLKELNVVKNGERGDFQKISNIEEINSIAGAIENMVNSLYNSNEIISNQNRDLSDKLVELRVMKKTLRETQKRARLGSWSWFPTRGFSFSPLTQKIFNIDKSIMTRWEVLHLIPQYSRHYLIKKVFKQIRTDRKISIDIEFINNMWVSLTGDISYTIDGEVICIHGTLQDITERVKRERERDELSLAIKQSSDSILITDVNANIIFVNDTIIKKSGYSREELIGKNPKILSSGRTRSGTYKSMWDTLQKGKTWKGIFYNRSKNGQEYTEFCSITPLKRVDGSIYRFIGVKEDISKQNLNEDDFDRYWKKMESLVEERTEELVTALDKAEESSRAKEKFIANMSHEIRTPMNAIIGMTNLLNDTQLDNRQKEYINNIEISGNLLLSIINDILDFSKAEAGMMTLTPTTIELPFLLKDIYYMLENQAKKKSLELIIQNNTEIKGISVDSLRLTQALVNLLNNSIKFTEYGSVTLYIDRIGERDNSVKLLFTVEDTGLGIDDELKKKLFIPYKQGNDTYTRKQGGSGLGLVITQKIIELFGGEIGFRSKVGRGSSFWFSFTCPKAELPSNHNTLYNRNKIYDQLNSLGNLSILVADDDEINQQVISGLFDSENISTDVVRNGLEVLKQLNNNVDYDLIFMDMQMPEMDGLEASVKVREINPLIPIIALTANAYDTDKTRCFDSGMNDFLTKPYSPLIIYNSVYKWIVEYRNDCEYIQLERVKELFGTNIKTYISITTKFFKTYNKLTRDIMDIKFVHKLKGSASNLGFKKVVSLCILSLENREDLTLKEEIITELDRTYEVVNKIESNISKIDQSLTGPVEKLVQLLNNNSIESINYFNNNSDILRKKMKINDFIELNKSISCNNFSESRRICSNYA